MSDNWLNDLLDPHAEELLAKLFPDAIPNDGMTAWESVADDVKETLRKLVAAGVRA